MSFFKNLVDSLEKIRNNYISHLVIPSVNENIPVFLTRSIVLSQ